MRTIVTKNVFFAISDPTRRAVLDLLAGGSRTAGAIVARFPRLTQPGISKHLRVLRDTKLVDVTVRAQERVYTIKPQGLAELYEWVAKYQAMWPDTSRPWNATSTPGPPVKSLGGRSDDKQAPRKHPEGRCERWFDNASLGITARRARRPDPDDGNPSIARRHGHVRGRVRHDHIRAKHPAPDPRRVGSPHRIRASRPLVHDASPPRCARRGEHRLQKRPGSISRDGEDPRVAT